MLADHVEAEIFQHLEIIDHGLFSRCCIDSIGPEALVEGAEHEYELAVQQRPNDTVDSALGNSTEPGIALDLIFTQCDRDIIQIR